MLKIHASCLSPKPGFINPFHTYCHSGKTYLDLAQPWVIREAQQLLKEKNTAFRSANRDLYSKIPPS